MVCQYTWHEMYINPARKVSGLKELKIPEPVRFYYSIYNAVVMLKTPLSISIFEVPLYFFSISSIFLNPKPWFSLSRLEVTIFPFSFCTTVENGFDILISSIPLEQSILISINLSPSTAETACRALSRRLPRITVKSNDEKQKSGGRDVLIFILTPASYADRSFEFIRPSIAGNPVCTISILF